MSFNLVLTTDSLEYVSHRHFCLSISQTRFTFFSDGTHPSNFCDRSLHRIFQMSVTQVSHVVIIFNFSLCVWVPIRVYYSFMQQIIILVQVTISFPFEHCNYLLFCPSIIPSADISQSRLSKILTPGHCLMSSALAHLEWVTSTYQDLAI